MRAIAQRHLKVPLWLMGGSATWRKRLRRELADGTTGKTIEMGVNDRQGHAHGLRSPLVAGGSDPLPRPINEILKDPGFGRSCSCRSRR